MLAMTLALVSEGDPFFALVVFGWIFIVHV
jgi:hypothetical protein